MPKAISKLLVTVASINAEMKGTTNRGPFSVMIRAVQKVPNRGATKLDPLFIHTLPIESIVRNGIAVKAIFLTIG